jgi:hypothetical protein
MRFCQWATPAESLTIPFGKERPTAVVGAFWPEQQCRPLPDIPEIRSSRRPAKIGVAFLFPQGEMNRLTK